MTQPFSPTQLPRRGAHTDGFLTVNVREFFFYVDGSFWFFFWVVELCVVCVHSGWGWSCDGVSRPLFTPLAGLSSFFSGLLPRNSPFCARVPPSLVVGSARVGGGGFVLFWVPFVAKTSPFVSFVLSLLSRLSCFLVSRSKR